MSSSSNKLLASSSQVSIAFAVAVCAAGNMVDVFDLAIFTRVRLQSLRELGLSEEQCVTSGAMLFNFQLAGLCLGAFAWGIIADVIGRQTALFGSIATYSIATLLNATVGDIGTYAIWRFLAGFGLAGEIGAAITLVTDLLPLRLLPLGSMLIAFAGFVGSLAASLAGEYLPWRAIYILGGVLGLSLLSLRIHPRMRTVLELTSLHSRPIGRLFRDLRSPRILRLAIGFILLGLPTWYVSAVLIQFSPELAKALGVTTSVTASSAAIAWAIGNLVGDLLCGVISYLTQAKRGTIISFLFMGFFSVSLLLSYATNSKTASTYYWHCGIVGCSMGYWAVFLGYVSSSFPREIRGSASTVIPNLIRFAAIPMTTIFALFQTQIGALGAARAVGLSVFTLAVLGMFLVMQDSSIHERMDDDSSSV